MSVNLVDLVMKQVGGNLPGIIGSLLGESADRTQGALAGAVPAILGGLMGAASKGGDVTEQLTQAIGQQDDGILDDFSSAFGGGNHQQIADQGSSLLSSLLGDGALTALTGAIGKFSGLGGGSTKSLLGMLVPIVMSVLSREQKSQGLDGGGLMNLLMDQKDSIQAAMPSGLAGALEGAGLLDNLMGTAAAATEAVSEAVGTAADKAGEVASEAAAAASGAAQSVGEAASQASGSARAAVDEAVESAGDAARQAAGSAGEAASKGAEAAGKAAQNVASGASEVASDARAAAAGAAQSGGSMMRWLLPLIILLALLWFAFKFLGGGEEEAAGDAQGTGEATTEQNTQ